MVHQHLNSKKLKWNFWYFNLQNATLQQYNSLLEWSSWGGKPRTLFFLSFFFFIALKLLLSVNVFSTKVLIKDTILTSPTGVGATILCGHPIHAKVWLFACRAKVVPSFLSYFQSISPNLASGIEPPTSCSAIKHSTEWELILLQLV